MPTPCPEPCPLMRKRAPEPAGAMYCLAACERAACGAETSVTAATRARRAARVRAMRRKLPEGSGHFGRAGLYTSGRHLRGDEASVSTEGGGRGFLHFYDRVRRENGLRGEQEQSDIRSRCSQRGP